MPLVPAQHTEPQLPGALSVPNLRFPRVLQVLCNPVGKLPYMGHLWELTERSAPHLLLVTRCVLATWWHQFCCARSGLFSAGENSRTACLLSAAPRVKLAGLASVGGLFREPL